MISPKSEYKTSNEMEELKHLLSLDHKKILELGCGKAEITRFIAATGLEREVIATEVDKVQHTNNMLIKDIPNVTFLMAGAEDIPLEDESIDVVLMFKSLHHVPVDLMSHAFKEIKRVLKQGGVVYISEPVFNGDFNEVLRIFHDEENVREMAYRAINHAISSKEFLSVKEMFFNVPLFFDSFESFEKNIINVTHSHHQLSDALIQRVKEQFSINIKDDGAHFLMPIRVNLLKK
ncbi:MAG: methyltransferase domain-containing protein [Chromatiales bacterium]|nr:methyltransferase domain-containing protein [Chromatiales bacterium]